MFLSQQIECKFESDFTQPISVYIGFGDLYCGVVQVHRSPDYWFPQIIHYCIFLLNELDYQRNNVDNDDG